MVNPYVGPRPFQEGERLHGRRRELDELMDLLYAERVVLLHSPSGAGKSSLVAAGLVPRLRRRFAVPPTIRLHQMPPDGPHPVSRYTWSALESLEAGTPASLAGYLKKRPQRDDEPPRSLLVFDQFEEVLSVDPANAGEKRRFFADLGEALADERLWALFVVHEEYVGPLETYRELLPGGLRSTYRLDFLDHQAAAEAIKRPAKHAGRTFSEAAVKKLVGELAKVQTQDVDGSIRETTGRFVEPVQLQVVCQQLWDAVPADDLSIGPEDVERFGDVTRALGSYYDASVAEAAGGDERAVREWFERELVVAGTRAQVLLGAKESGGLPNERIERLRERHLVRAEKRAGKTWFELAHDRLIESVRESNRRWFEANLQPVQQQARLWASQGRPPGFRLADGDLRAAEEWAKTAELTRDEKDFLETSREAQRNAEEIRRQKERALELARAATASSCLASGETTWGSLFALEIVDPEKTPTAAAVLHQALASRPDVPTVLEGHGGDVYTACFSPDGGRVLTASADKTARIWDAWTGECLHVLAGHSDAVPAAGWSADASRVVTASHDKTARIWDAGTGETLHTLCGHGGQVITAAWDAGSRRVVTASEDRTARIWDAQTGESLHVLPGHGVQVRTVAWDGDSRRVVTGSLDKTARVWDAGTGEELHVLAGHEDCVNVAAWNVDSTRVLTASQDGTARVWTAEDGRIEAILPRKGGDKHSETIFSAAWRGDGTSVATGSLDGTARVWGTRGGDLLHVLRHSDAVLSVAWSHDGTRLVTASRDQMARLWDTRTGKLLDTLSGHSDWVLAAEWSGDGRRVVTASKDHTARVFTVEPGERLHTLPAPRGPWGPKPYKRVAWSGDGRCVATAGDDAVHLWDAGTGERLRTLETEESGIKALVFHGGRLLTGSTDGTARLWDAASGGLLHELSAGHRGGCDVAVWSDDGSRALTAFSNRPAAQIWDARTGERTHTLEGHSDRIRTGAWNGDATRVVTGAEDGTAHLWDAETGKLLRTLPGHSAEIVATGWKGRRVLTAAGDGTLRIWDSETGEPLRELAGGSTLLTAAFDRDGARVLTVFGAEASIWDVGTGERVHVLAGHSEKILAAAWSHDGRRVLTASRDATVRLWDAATGESLHALLGHSSAVLAAAWSEDDTRVLTASEDETARLWAVGPAEHLQGRIRAETRRTLPVSLRRKRLGESDGEARRRAGVERGCLGAFFQRLEGAERGEVEPYVAAWRDFRRSVGGSGE